VLRGWLRVGGIGDRDGRMRTMILWIRIHLLDDIGDMTVSAKRVLRFTEWRKGEGIALFYRDQEIQLWQQQLSALQNHERRDPEHLVANKVSTRRIIHTTLPCLLLDVLDLHMDLKRVS
jgi:hypothetical protein